MNFTVYLIRQNAYSRIKIIIFLLESCYICFMNRDSCKGVFQGMERLQLELSGGVSLLCPGRDLQLLAATNPLGILWSEMPVSAYVGEGGIHILTTCSCELCMYKSNLSPGFSDRCELFVLHLGPVASSCVVCGHAMPRCGTRLGLLCLPGGIWLSLPASVCHTGSDSFLRGMQPPSRQ